MQVAVAILVMMVSVLGSVPNYSVPPIHAQTPPPTWSAHCHITDGTFSTCPDGSKEWSDVTPKYFPQSNSYLYADQAKLNASIPASLHATDTLVLLYDECGMTKALGPDQYFLVSFPTVETENGVKVLNHYVIHIFTDGTIVFIENGVPQGPSTGPYPYRVSTIEGMKGQAGFGPSPNCPTNHVITEFQIPLSAAGGDSYSPDPLYWSASVPDQPPIALFVFSPGAPVAGQNVVFDASMSYDPDGTVVSYSWSFGDGQSGIGVSPGHLYANAGTFTVGLTVTDNSGSVDSTTHQVMVGQKQANIPPTACFTITPSPTTVGQAVSFDASCSSDPDDSIVSYAWTFGDMTKGTGVSATHTYSSTGSFAVSLNVTDNGTPSKSDRIIKTLAVKPPFDYSLAVNPATGTVTLANSAQSIEAFVTATFNAGVAQEVTLSGAISSPSTGISVTFSPPSVTPASAGTSAFATITVQSNAAPGTYTITISGNPPGASGSTATFTLVVNSAIDYSLNALPGTLTIVINAAGSTETVTATRLAGSPESVGFNIAGLPPYVTASAFNPTSCTATCSSQVVLTAGALAKPISGTTITITSTSTSGLVKTASFTLVVKAASTSFDYSVVWSPPGASVVVGSGTSSSVVATLISGSATSVSCSVMPPLVKGLTVAPATFSFTPSASQSIAISTNSSTPLSPSGYSISVSCSGGGVTHSASFVLVVNAPFDYSLTVAPSTLTLSAGGASGTENIVASLLGGITESVSFTVSTVPSGVNSFFSPTSCSPTCSTSLILSASSTATPTAGVTVTIKGASVSGLVKTVSFTLVVQTPTVHDVAVTGVSASPTSVPGGATVAIVVTVKNTGNVAEPNVAVQAAAESAGNNIPPFGTTLISLNVGASVNVNITWFTPNVAGVYTIKGIATLATGETDPTLSDNSFFDGTVMVSTGNQPPVASFTFSPEVPLVNQAVAFNATASSDPNSGVHITIYHWSFGDGNNTDTGVPTVSHSYKNALSFQVSLTVTDSLGLKSSPSIQTVTVTTIPYVPGVKIGDWAEYVYSGTPDPFSSGAPPTLLYFTFNITGVQGTVITAATTFFWGNGTKTTQSFQTDIARSSFPFLFIAANLTQGDPIFPGLPLTLNSTISGTFAGAPRQANVFSPRSALLSNTTPIMWDKISGVLVAETVAINFGLQGGIIVNLQLVDTNIWPATTDKAPVPLFTWTPFSPSPGQAVSFNGTRSFDPDVNDHIASYQWNFGDGKVASGVLATHAFSTGGTFNVTLTVTDAHGVSTTSFKFVTVQIQYLPGVKSGDWAVYSISGNATSSVVFSSILFFRVNVTSVRGTLVNGTLTQIFTNETVSRPFSYDVSSGQGAELFLFFSAANLTAGEPISSGSTLILNSTIAGSFVGAVRQANLLRVSFPSISASLAWDQISGLLLTEAVTVHGNPGSFYVKLTLVDANVWTATSDKGPAPAFGWAPPVPSPAQTVSFNATASFDPDLGGSIASYRWNFGDGVSSNTGPLVSHSYSNSGFYNVTLTVTDKAGFSATSFKIIKIGPTHNVSVMGVFPSTNTATIGQFVGISVEVSNQGDLPETFNVTVSAGSFLVGSPKVQTVTLQPGFTTEVFFAWNTTGFAPGTYPISASVALAPGETNHGISSLRDGNVTLTAPGTVHDVAVTGVSASPSSIAAGSSIVVSVTVRNTGNFAENGIIVKAGASSSSQGNFGSGSGISLAPGASQTVNLTITLPLAGIYSINGKAFLPSGETDPTPSDNSLTDGTVTVTSNLPVASFTIAPSAPLIGQVVTFDASLSSDPNSGAHIVSYLWNFGDGNSTSTSLPTITHSYKSQGFYSVSLTVVDNLGFVSTPQVLSLLVTRIPYVPGVTVGEWARYVLSQNGNTFLGSINFVTITLNVTRVVGTNVTIAFTVTASNGTSVTSTMSGDIRMGSGGVALIIPANLTKGDLLPSGAGVFGQGASFINDTIPLTVLGANRQVNVLSTGAFVFSGLPIFTSTFQWEQATGMLIGWNVTITGTGSFQFRIVDTNIWTPTNSPPAPIFYQTLDHPLLGQTVQFNATRSYDPDGDTIASYHWTFGDGSAANTAAPIHSYSTNGTYIVTMTVTDSKGASATSFRPIRVGTFHDIGIGFVETSASLAPVGTPIGILVEVVDFGDYNESSTVRVSLSNSTQTIRLTPQPVTVTVPASGQLGATFRFFLWNTTGLAPGSYRITASVDAVPGEINLSNNLLQDGNVTITRPGAASQVLVLQNTSSTDPPTPVSVTSAQTSQSTPTISAAASTTTPTLTVPDSDGVPDYLDNCPYTPTTDQRDSLFDGIGDACRPASALHSTAAFLEANPNGGTAVTAQNLSVSSEPNATVVVTMIVMFRVESKMTSPADAAALTQTLVGSQVEEGFITQTQATAVVSSVASAVDSIAPIWPSSSNLAASGIGQTSLTLTWTAATDDFSVTSYRIYQGNTLVATVSGSVLTYTVTGLSPSTSYTFRVQAGDAANNWSSNGPSTQAATQAAPSPTPPSPPPTIFGLPPWLFYAIVGIAVALVVIISVAIALSRRRPRNPQA